MPSPRPIPEGDPNGQRLVQPHILVWKFPKVRGPDIDQSLVFGHPQKDPEFTATAVWARLQAAY